jgi:hypothetical protein
VELKFHSQCNLKTRLAGGYPGRGNTDRDREVHGRSRLRLGTVTGAKSLSRFKVTWPVCTPGSIQLPVIAKCTRPAGTIGPLERSLRSFSEITNLNATDFNFEGLGDQFQGFHASGEQSTASY